MKLIQYLSENIQGFYKPSNLVFLVFLFAFVPFPVLACENGPPPVPTQAERFASADLVFSGKIVTANNNRDPRYLDLKLEVANILKGQAGRIVTARAVTHVPCGGEGLYFLKSDQWWTFYLKRDNATGTLYIVDVDAFCEKNTRQAPDGPPRTCSKVLAQAVELNRLTIDAGSMVSVGPERSITDIQFARLQGRSTLSGIALPPGTAWFATLNEFDFPSRLTIGPASMIGRVGLYLPDSDGMRGRFYATRLPNHHGELTLHGAQVHNVWFTAPGWVVQEARLSRPGVMRGIHIADYVTFTPDGKFATFRSGRDQIVNGVRLKKCDNVDLVDGRVVAGKFYNPCAGR